MGEKQISNCECFDARFTPVSGHYQLDQSCPESANNGQELTRFNPMSATERLPSFERSAYLREPLRQIRHRHRYMCR
jgi:hypothetical protein